jgi:hypothetical protein
LPFALNQAARAVAFIRDIATAGSIGRVFEGVVSPV